MAITFKIEGGAEITAVPEAKETILDTAQRVDVAIDAPCGGNFCCGKCRVKLLKGELTGERPRSISEADWENGWRLACQHESAGDVSVLVPAQAYAFQHDIRVLDMSGKREQSAFEDWRAALASQGISGGGGFRTVAVTLDPPTFEDACADRERFLLALANKLDTGEHGITLALPALRHLPLLLRQSHFTVTALLRDEGGGTVTVLDVESPRKPLAGIAIDLGTTTVSMMLIDLESGRLLAAASGGNPQIRFGADIIIRIIESGKPGGLERLRRAVVNECFAPLIARLCEGAGVQGLDSSRIYRIALAGNATMTHLFLGIPPDHLRLEPYIPAFFAAGPFTADELGLPVNSMAQVICAPAIGSYVGGDITAGVFAADFYRTAAYTLFIDLGTNGELVFGNNEFLFSCACSAGPAFEGGEISCGMRATTGAIEQCLIGSADGAPSLTIIGGPDVKPLGLCGSGLIHCIAELFQNGYIDAKGKFAVDSPRIIRDGYGGAGYLIAGAQESADGREIVLTEADIDNFMRAKAAVFSAIRTMLAIVDFSIEVIDTVYIAGGIGSGIDIDHAITIGMFPKLPKDKFRYIGNSSLSGAYAMLTSPEAVQKIQDIAGSMTYLELSSHPGYMDEFIAACFLPHTDGNLFA